MKLASIELTHFKNYELQKFVFNEKINVITGLNGSGKTNLLDAMFYQCMCKSLRNTQDILCIKHDRDFFRITSFFLKNEIDDFKIVSTYRKDLKKKQFVCNDISYQKLNEHIGLFPIIAITPNDISLINEGSEERRKFLDIVLSQCDKTYLQKLVLYNKLIEQRNAYLKSTIMYQELDQIWLDSIDEQLSSVGTFIFEFRKLFFKELPIIFKEIYQELSDDNEKIELHYQSQMHKEKMLDALKNRRVLDHRLQRTSVGIHRDDVLIQMQELEAKKLASQGQLKSILLSLKFSVLKWIHKQLEVPPILLLDDVCDKLDARRLEKLLLIIHQSPYQVFITDTSEELIPNIFLKNKIPFAHIPIYSSKDKI